MRPAIIVEAPSRLGLRAAGVEHLPAALLDAGLARALQADLGGRVPTLPFDPQRDPLTGVLNAPAIAEYAGALADVVAPLVLAQQFPVVLGGDCSILLGPMLALRRLGRYGLVHLDGHADFYQPAAEPEGEVASMDLALVTGRGPSLLTNLEGRGPLVRDTDVVQVGCRDAAEAAAAGSHDIHATNIKVLDLAAVRPMGADRAAEEAAAYLSGTGLAGFWIHLDADVLNDTVMPAVDYRLPDGLERAELSAVVRRLTASGQAVGMTVTIYNPLLDPDGAIGQAFVASLIDGLTGS